MVEERENLNRLPLISVVICTRNRGSLIEATLHSILQGTSQPDEILVVDQSEGEETRQAVNKIALEAPAVRYHATTTRGLSQARNVGVEQCRGTIIAFTDDDVIVCTDWLERIVAEFEFYPRLALLFGTVLPPDTYDWTQEFIPYTQLKTRRPVAWWSQAALEGIGANMALRRKTFDELGGFDVTLGAGTAIAGYEDYEYALRCVCHRPPLVMHTLDEARVIHHAGARRGAEYHNFVHRMNGTGRGLFWAYLMGGQRGIKYKLKAGQGLISPLGEFLRQLTQGKKPSGLRTYAYSLQGFVKGLKKKHLPH